MRMIAFRWHSPSGSGVAILVAVFQDGFKTLKESGGFVTVTNSVEYYLGAIKQRAGALLQRQYKTVVALGLLLPTFAYGQGE